MTADLDLVCNAFGDLPGGALHLLACNLPRSARAVLSICDGPIHWSPTVEPAIDRVMTEDSLLTRVLAVLVGVPGHHRSCSAKDVRRALQVLDDEIAKAERETT